MKAKLNLCKIKLIFFLVFLINYVTSFHFDFSKEAEKCIIEEFFNDTVSLINSNFITFYLLISLFYISKLGCNNKMEDIWYKRSFGTLS